jgi:hypothetical protein
VDFFDERYYGYVGGGYPMPEDAWEPKKKCKACLLYMTTKTKDGKYWCIEKPGYISLDDDACSEIKDWTIVNGKPVPAERSK